MRLAQVGIQFLHILALCNGTHNNAKTFGLDALHQTAQTASLLAALNLL